MSSVLKDKIVVVTGAGRGIGREIALLCASHGASVLINDYGGSGGGEGRDAGPAHEVVKEIEAAGGVAAGNSASVAEPDGAASIIRDAFEKFGRIDAVINTAGILRDRIFHKMEPTDWHTVVDTNLHGTYYVSRAAAPYFKEQGFGAFVHFTSASGLIGNFGQANYSASKLGVVGLSTSIALDMQRFGVRSNCICPFAWSRLIATIPVDTEEERLRVERLKSMTPAKIAPMAVFLASDAAAEVTGQVFGVRKNEIFLFSLPRPIRSMHRSEGWTPESIASDMLPALRPNFQKLQRSSDVFSWDPA